MLIVGRGKERMCRGYMKRLRRHQSMVTLGLGAGAVSLGSHTDTVRRDAPTCLAMQGPGDQVVLALGHTVPGTDQCEGMEAVEVRLPDGALLERNRVFVASGVGNRGQGVDDLLRVLAGTARRFEAAWRDGVRGSAAVDDEVM